MCLLIISPVWPVPWRRRAQSVFWMTLAACLMTLQTSWMPCWSEIAVFVRVVVSSRQGPTDCFLPLPMLLVPVQTIHLLLGPFRVRFPPTAPQHMPNLSTNKQCWIPQDCAQSGQHGRRPSKRWHQPLGSAVPASGSVPECTCRADPGHNLDWDDCSLLMDD